MQNILENLIRKEEHYINARASTSYRAITNKKISPPLIELKKILKGEVVINNPKLRLSIEDYNLMCKNKILRKMMAKILNIDINSLTAY